MIRPPLLPGLLLALLLLLAAPPAPAAEPQPEEPITRIHLTSSVIHIAEKSSMWELMRRIFHPLGIQVVGELKPFVRAHQDLVDGLTDAVLPSFAFHANGLRFPRWHVYLDRIVTLFPRDDPRPWEGYRTIAGQRVGWVRGYSLHFFFDEPIPLEVVEVDQVGQCLDLLRAGRVAFCLDTDFHLEQRLTAQGREMADYRVESLYQEPSYLRFADTPRARRLMALFDRRLDQLHASGELARIFDELGFSPHLEPGQRQLARWPELDFAQIARGEDPWSSHIRFLH